MVGPKLRSAGCGVVRLGLVGAGPWGRACLRTLTALDGVAVAAVASRNPQTAALVPAGCRVTADWRDLLAVAGLDGVVIASPPASHGEIAAAAVEAGLAVFVEKPLTLSSAEARRLRSLAAARGARVFFTDHVHLFSPAFRRLAELVAECGPLLAIDGVAGDHGPYRGDVPVLWDWGAHDVAMMAALAGRAPDRVAATRLERRPVAGGMGEVVRLDLGFGAVAGRATVGTLMDKVRRLSVLCENGNLVYDDLARAKLTRNGVAVEVEPALPLTVALGEFAAAIRDGGRHLAGLDVGVMVVDVLERAQAALDHPADGGGPGIPSMGSER
jgi:predicted dehydrogenase